MTPLRAVLVLALLPAPVLALDFPDVPVPKGARGERVSDHMRYNGLDMRASQFSIDQPVERVRAFYLQEWEDQVADTALDGGGRVLGYLHRGRDYVTVTLRPAGRGTEGTIGVMRLPLEEVAPDAVGKGFERLPRTEVSEDIVYLDTPRQVRTLNMSNAHSPFQNERFYTRQLGAQGYVREPGDACQASSQLCQVRYTRDSDRITVTAMRGKDATAIVAVIE